MTRSLVGGGIAMNEVTDGGVPPLPEFGLSFGLGTRTIGLFGDGCEFSE